MDSHHCPKPVGQDGITKVIYDMILSVIHKKYMLETWELGKQCLGAVSNVIIDGDQILFQRSEAKDLIVSTSTDFTQDHFGRIIFSTPNRSLATLYPEHIDPTRSLADQQNRK